MPPFLPLHPNSAPQIFPMEKWSVFFCWTDQETLFLSLFFFRLSFYAFPGHKSVYSTKDAMPLPSCFESPLRVALTCRLGLIEKNRSDLSNPKRRSWNFIVASTQTKVVGSISIFPFSPGKTLLRVFGDRLLILTPSILV